MVMLSEHWRRKERNVVEKMVEGWTLVSGQKVSPLLSPNRLDLPLGNSPMDLHILQVQRSLRCANNINP